GKTGVHNTTHNLRQALPRSCSTDEKPHGQYRKAPSFDAGYDFLAAVWQIMECPDRESECEMLSIPNGFARSNPRSSERHRKNHDRSRIQNFRSPEFHFDGAHPHVSHTLPISEFSYEHQKDFDLAMIRSR